MFVWWDIKAIQSAKELEFVASFKAVELFKQTANSLLETAWLKVGDLAVLPESLGKFDMPRLACEASAGFCESTGRSWKLQARKNGTARVWEKSQVSEETQVCRLCLLNAIAGLQGQGRAFQLWLRAELSDLSLFWALRHA